MGWNSWNHFGCEINENVIKAAADKMVQLGLAELGYKYVNVDDCWAVREGTLRDEQGNVVVDKTRFPSGIKALADYVHSKGLLFGIYSDAGEFTCAGQPGSLGYEEIDAKQYAAWGVDYLKYDNCYNKGIPAKDRYQRMHDALNATGRPIFYSLCNWGEQDTTSWAPKLGNSWRTTDDIRDFWWSMKNNFLQNGEHPEVAAPGGWNDPDMLEIGNGGMTHDEYKQHFALWAVAKAPLIIGANLLKINEEALSIYRNKELIEVNQDRLGVQGTCKMHCNTAHGGP